MEILTAPARPGEFFPCKIGWFVSLKYVVRGTA